MKTGLNDAQAQFLAAEFVRPLAFFGAAFAAFNGLSKEHAWIVVSALILMAACAKSILSARAAFPLVA